MGRRTTYHDWHNNILTRQGSGSFVLDSHVDNVKELMLDHGATPTGYTAGCVAAQVWQAVYDKKIDVRPPQEPGEERFKPKPETAAAAKATRRELPDGSPVQVSNRMMDKVGRPSRTTKRELLKENYKLRAGLVAPIPEEGDEDVSMDVDAEPAQNVGQGQLFGVAGPLEGHSRDPLAPLPRTPQRTNPAQAYLTPPNTTSPLSRQGSRSQFEQRSASFADIAGPSGSSGMSHWEEDISTAVTEDDLNVAVSAMSRASDTLRKQEEENAQIRAELEEAHARAEAERERAQREVEENEVMAMLLARTEQELVDAYRVNDQLAEERDMYRAKHCGAEAALKGSQLLGERRAQHLEQALRADMDNRFRQYQCQW